MPMPHHGVQTGRHTHSLVSCAEVLSEVNSRHPCVAFASQKACRFTAALTPAPPAGWTSGLPALAALEGPLHQGLRKGENISPPHSVNPHLSTAPQPAWPRLHHSPELPPPGRTTLPPQNHALPTVLRRPWDQLQPCHTTC
uniref:Uncharacterized protein n=1 Tax=Molossus molossus TaxID=27622 RepID=A0A7J8DCA1_MOLMO|nr:hypothetical protein HJG59_009349 [Molossus molossus]